MWSVALPSCNILAVPRATKELSCTLTMRSHRASKRRGVPFCCHSREHREQKAGVCVPVPMAWVWAGKLPCPRTPRARNHAWYRSTLAVYFCGSLYIWFVSGTEQDVAERRKDLSYRCSGQLCVEGQKLHVNGEGKSLVFRRVGSSDHTVLWLTSVAEMNSTILGQPEVPGTGSAVPGDGALLCRGVIFTWAETAKTFQLRLYRGWSLLLSVPVLETLPKVATKWPPGPAGKPQVSQQLQGCCTLACRLVTAGASQGGKRLPTKPRREPCAGSSASTGDEPGCPQAAATSRLQDPGGSLSRFLCSRGTAQH